MIRTKGEAGTGNVVEAVRHARAIQREIRLAQSMSERELHCYAAELHVSVELLKKTAQLGRLPVVNFAAGGGRGLCGVWDIQECQPGEESQVYGAGSDTLQ